MEKKSASLSHEQLRAAVEGRAAAFRSVTEYQPVGGEGSKVFPSTYAGGVYAFEQRRMGGSEHACVILDSVASQANRMEEALLDAWDDGAIRLPVISVDFSKEFSDIGRITSLDAPHRIADAILRYAKHDDGKQFFSKGEYANLWKTASIHNATPLFKLCPTALVFGTWGSPGATGGLGPKFQRIVVSELIGVDAVAGTKTSSRIDPTGIGRGVVLYPADKQSGDLEWTVEESRAVREKSKVIKGKKPSELNLGNVTPTAEYAEDVGGLFKGGGVTISRALQFTTLSLPALRRLRFPIDGQRDTKIDAAARTALAALALCAATLARDDGADLRSRCHLVPTSELEWELIGKPGETPVRYSLDADQATSLLKEAVQATGEAGLEWHEAVIKLVPSQQLIDAIRRSRERGGAEEEQ